MPDPRPLVTRAYWVERPGQGALREERLPPEMPAGYTLVRARYTGVSPGTERLVGLGLVPPASRAAMACPGMAGSFALPVKYGYTLVGRGVRGALAGRRLFAMHPHQGLAWVEDARAFPLPAGLSDRRALLLPNMETALNAVWDAEVAPGERAVVFGAGVVGLLVAHALAEEGAARAVVVEPDAARRRRARALPFVRDAVPPEAAPRGAAVAFEASGAPEALQAALDAVGFEGRVVALSWYGARKVTLDLGGGFHHARKRILSSQVGAVAPSRRGEIDRRTRLSRAAVLLREPALDALVAEPRPAAALPAIMADLYRGVLSPGMPAVAWEEDPCSPSP